MDDTYHIGKPTYIQESPFLFPPRLTAKPLGGWKHKWWRLRFSIKSPHFRPGRLTTRM